MFKTVARFCFSTLQKDRQVLKNILSQKSFDMNALEKTHDLLAELTAGEKAQLLQWLARDFRSHD